MDSSNPISQLRAIFEQVVDAPLSARSALLDELCGSNLALRGQVEELLRRSENLGDFLERPIASLAPLLNKAVQREEAGDIIGPYVLAERIGEGSFSTVWSARQVHPIRREVAMKILKPGLDVQSIVERFDHERDALARLEHPNICRIYDAGIHASGRPYFVMERVRGSEITEYARHNALDSQKILALMVSLANAIEYAHQQGLIHRDLKPANVLVSTIDGNPSPKVIDFGIARIITPDRDSPGTLAIVPSGTPAYMSPEQATFGPVDGRADVYAMGVILLELLTTERAASDRSMRTVAALLDRHSVEPHVSAVVLKAMQSDPLARYGSPGEFAKDLQRILDGQQPVARRPRSSAYRRALAMSLAFAVVLVAIMVTRALTSSPAMIVTPVDVAWPEPVAMKQLWRIQPEGNAGWWSVEIDAAARRAFAITSTRDLLEIDLDTGEIIRTIRPDGRPVVRVALSSDKQRLFLVTETPGDLDQRLITVDRAGNILAQLDLPGATYAICLLDDRSTRVAVSTRINDTSRIDFYDLATGQRIATTPSWSSTFAPAYLVAHPWGDSVYATTPAGEIVRIGAGSGRTLATLGPADPSTAVLRWLDERRLVLTGHYGATVFDTATDQPVTRLTALHKTISAALDVDGSIQLSTVDHRITRYNAITAAPDASLDVAGDPRVVEFPHVIPGSSSFLVASQDGSLRLMSADAAANNNTLTLVQTPPAATQPAPELPDVAWARQVAPEGGWSWMQVDGTRGRVWAVEMYGGRKLFEVDLRTGETLRADSPDARPVRWADVSPDGARIVVLTGDASTNGGDAIAHVLNTADRTVVRSIPVAGGSPRIKFVDRAGTRLAILRIGTPARVEFVDVTTGKTVCTSESGVSDESKLTQLDDRSILAHLVDNTPLRIDADNGRVLQTFPAMRESYSPVTAAAAHNRLLRCGSNAVRSYDLTTGQLISVYRASHGVYTASLSADGKRVFAWGERDAVTIFDAATARPIRHLRQSHVAPTAGYFSADGKWLGICSTDGTIRTWNFPD